MLLRQQLRADGMEASLVEGSVGGEALESLASLAFYRLFETYFNDVSDNLAKLTKK
jgi:hypothetical protein